MRTDMSTYDANILFSCLRGTSTLKFDTTEYKTIKSGSYKKLLKHYYSSYNSNGNKTQQVCIGGLFDKYI